MTPGVRIQSLTLPSARSISARPLKEHYLGREPAAPEPDNHGRVRTLGATKLCAVDATVGVVGRVDQVDELSWVAKVGAVPTLPSPTEDWPNQLVRVLSKLRDDGPQSRDERFENPGSKTIYTFGQYADQLAPFDLVVRTQDRAVAIGHFGLQWLKSPGAENLARQLHARARFVGELLQILEDGPKEIAALLDVANEHYGLEWKSYDQVRRRLIWLITLGCAERHFGNRYSITAFGRELLATFPLRQPGSVAEPAAHASLPPAGPVVAALLATLAADPSIDRGRHRGLGYLPANADSPLENSVKTLTAMCVNEIDADDFIAKAQRQFSISPSSARSALGSLRSAGLLEPTGRATFTATHSAREWLESGSLVDLVRIVHTTTFPTGEVVGLIDEAKKAPALAALVEARYGTGSTSTLATGRVIQLLLAAGLIREVGYARYASTTLGRAFAAEVPLRPTLLVRDGDAPHTSGDDADRPAAKELAKNIIEAGIRSDQPRMLELAVAAAFNFLGASAQSIGGPGNTDVLVEIGVQPSHKVVAIVDAKTAGQGTVNEGAVKLDAIEDHKKKHRATLAAIVAPGFADRLSKWAADRGIGLISTEFLADVVRRHEVSPLGRSELQMLLSGGDQHRHLASAMDARGRRADLVGRVMAVLLREAQEDDPNVEADLDLDGIYRAIRDQFQVKSDKDDLKAAVELLTSPLIAGVSKRGTAFAAVEPIATVRMRIESLGIVVDDAALAE